MKSLPASLTLAATAILQAMGGYAVLGDSIVVSGQVFFPILFALMALYLGWRHRESEKFGVLHAGLAVVGFAGLLVTMIGRVTENYSVYPSEAIYYAAFGLLVVEVALCILSVPKKVQDHDDNADQSAAATRSQGTSMSGSRGRVMKRSFARRRVAGSGPTHLMARAKSSLVDSASGASTNEASTRDSSDSVDGSDTFTGPGSADFSDR